MRSRPALLGHGNDVVLAVGLASAALVGPGVPSGCVVDLVFMVHKIRRPGRSTEPNCLATARAPAASPRSALELDEKVLHRVRSSWTSSRRKGGSLDSTSSDPVSKIPDLGKFFFALPPITGTARRMDSASGTPWSMHTPRDVGL